MKILFEGVGSSMARFYVAFPEGKPLVERIHETFKRKRRRKLLPRGLQVVPVVHESGSVGLLRVGGQTLGVFAVRYGEGP